jgi:hypothetical protein
MIPPPDEINLDPTLLSGTYAAREAIRRVPPSEPIGDTRVRAAPYRLLNREIDGWGKGNGFTPQGGKTENLSGEGNL